MTKVTVEDVVNLSPRELITKMTTKGEEPAIVVVTEPTEEGPPASLVLSTQPIVPTEQAAPASEQVQVDTDPAVKSEFNKKQLKGLFDDAHIFVKGQTFSAVHGISGGTVEVVSVENSSGRVKFKVQETGEIFSQAAAVLRGGKEELPYKKGDFILFEDHVYEIIGLNPANRNVVINLNGVKRYLKISKVAPVGGSDENVPTNGEQQVSPQTPTA